MSPWLQIKGFKNPKDVPPNLVEPLKAECAKILDERLTLAVTASFGYGLDERDVDQDDDEDSSSDGRRVSSSSGGTVGVASRDSSVDGSTPLSETYMPHQSRAPPQQHRYDNFPGSMPSEGSMYGSMGPPGNAGGMPQVGGRRSNTGGGVGGALPPLAPMGKAMGAVGGKDPFAKAHLGSLPPIGSPLK